ncbi:acetyltransferase [Sphingopyxis granuli]|uniref:acetyltransferase n=1 Tax=Sphingopyxis granuli TaxID=267128 RepID=UPI001F53782D|nr:acetyltransferase [Sphingopyxis granuli]UNK78265.1 acetyltransferase [Sphingopyxis granuli]
MVELRPSTDRDMPRVIDIWRRAVDATHDFLAPRDRAAIEVEVSSFLPQVRLLLAVDRSDIPLGFMFLHDGHLEALFIDPDHHGKGMGKALVHRALADHPGLTVDVNEQNPKALGFYERMGFERIGRSAHDGQGRPYPLVHLRHRSGFRPV